MLFSSGLNRLFIFCCVYGIIRFLILFNLRCPEQVILHDECAPLWSNLCDRKGHLSSTTLKNYISFLLAKAALQLDRAKYPNIRFNLCQYDKNSQCFLRYTKVGVNLTVYWDSEVYKNLTVSIDLTPGIPVLITEEQQMNDINSYARKELPDRLIHVVPYLALDEHNHWRASFSLIEVQMLKRLTKKQLSLYRCLKFLRDLHTNVLAPIPSYHLKTVLLTTLYKNSDEQHLKVIEQEDFYCSVSRVISALKKIEEEERAAEKKAVPHFFLQCRLDIDRYDIRWCRSILKHLHST